MKNGVTIDHVSARPTSDREAKLAVALASPRMAGLRDKEGWHALFAEGAVVEDPVGTPPCKKGPELLAFFDAFIGGNDIRFDSHLDVVVGMTVARDVTIHATMPTGFTSSVPAHLLYELVHEGGELRVARLAAHWEASTNGKQAKEAGLKGTASTMLSLGRILRAFGFNGLRDYVKGTQSGVRRPGREAVAALVTALSTGDLAAARPHISPSATIQVGDALPRPIVDLLADGGVDVRASDLRASGYTVSCRLEVTRDGVTHPGLGYFDFDRERRTIDSARLLFETAAT